ncbi:MAG: 30S ribosomal protein S12 methylthiotransferase RimO [Sphaerochaetaceae bacterium]
MSEIRGKHLYIENLGCAKNQVDAEIMLNELVGSGFVATEEASEADLILINTCGFIESARQESIQTFFTLKRENPQAKVVLTGCLSQRYAKELENELVEADGIFGNRDLRQITALATEVLRGNRVALSPQYPLIEKEISSRSQLFNYPGSAYVKISEGCNHRCRYCAIPLIRGSLRSRPLQTIVQEVHSLVNNNTKEINLIAQDLASYGTDTGQSRFMELLEHLVAIEGDFRLRLLYIHPDAFPLELIDFIKANAKVIPYFDLPFQHAHADVLRPMGRKGDKESYLALIKKIREALPQATIRSTIMLGFTGETEQTFAHLLEFLTEAHLDWVGSFVYSLEEGTPAYKDKTKSQYKAMVKKATAWQKELEKVQQEITVKRLQRLVGTQQQVLLEELVEGEDLAIGRTEQQAPEVDGLTVVLGRNLVPGTVIRCGIRRVNGIDLEAVPITVESI